MSELKIAGNPLPGMPWEERPEGCKNVMLCQGENGIRDA